MATVETMWVTIKAVKVKALINVSDFDEKLHTREAPKGKTKLSLMTDEAEAKETEAADELGG